MSIHELPSRTTGNFSSKGSNIQGPFPPALGRYPALPCYVCATGRVTRAFPEKPRDLAVGERAVTVVSSFLEFPATSDLWEIVVFHDVTAEKLDTALKVAGAAAHELRTS